MGSERYVVLGPADIGKPPRYPCAYFYTDGVQAAAARLLLEQRQQPSTTPLLLATVLVWRTAAALRLAGRSAIRNAGAFGDAIVETRLLGPHMLLAHSPDNMPPEPYFRTPLIRFARSQHTLPLSSLAGEPQELLVTVRIVLSDIVNAFGLAELPHIAPDGTLRSRYFPAGWKIPEWAERHGVVTTQELAPD